MATPAQVAEVRPGLRVPQDELLRRRVGAPDIEVRAIPVLAPGPDDERLEKSVEHPEFHEPVGLVRIEDADAPGRHDAIVPATFNMGEEVRIIVGVVCCCLPSFLDRRFVPGLDQDEPAALQGFRDADTGSYLAATLFCICPIKSYNEPGLPLLLEDLLQLAARDHLTIMPRQPVGVLAPNCPVIVSIYCQSNPPFLPPPAPAG
jgi:hypothetical protein